MSWVASVERGRFVLLMVVGIKVSIFRITCEAILSWLGTYVYSD